MFPLKFSDIIFSSNIPKGCFSANEFGGKSENHAWLLNHVWVIEKISNLKLDPHVPEKFCQIKLFPSLVRKNGSICLVFQNENKWILRV